MAANKLSGIAKIRAKEIITSVFLFNGDEQTAIDRVYQELGVQLSERQIQYYFTDIKKPIQENQEQQAQEALEEIRQKELKKLDYLELEVIQQWHRSKQNAESITVESVGVDVDELNQLKKDLPQDDKFADDPRNPDPTLKEDLKVQVKTKEKRKSSGRIAEPRYIKLLVEIQARRAQLLGLDKKDDRLDWREQLRKAGLDETTINAIEYQLTELISKYIAGLNNGNNTQSQENGYVS